MDISIPCFDSKTVPFESDAKQMAVNFIHSVANPTYSYDLNVYNWIPALDILHPLRNLKLIWNCNTQQFYNFMKFARSQWSKEEKFLQDLQIDFLTENTFPDKIYLNRPYLAWHGTPAVNIPSIFQKGLIVPEIPINGAVQGSGIYLSNSRITASDYAVSEYSLFDPNSLTIKPTETTNISYRHLCLVIFIPGLTVNFNSNEKEKEKADTTYQKWSGGQLVFCCKKPQHLFVLGCIAIRYVS